MNFNEDEYPEVFASITIEPQLVFDAEGLAISIKNFSSVSGLGTSVTVLVKNDTDMDIDVAPCVHINGLQMAKELGTDVAAGESTEIDVSMPSLAKIAAAGMSEVQNIALSFLFSDDDDLLHTKAFSIYGEDMVFDKEFVGVKINSPDFSLCILNHTIGTSGSLGLYDVYCYVENLTDHIIDLFSVVKSINGVLSKKEELLLSGILHVELLPHDTIFDAMHFHKFELKIDEPEKLKSITFTIKASDPNVYPSSVESVPITMEIGEGAPEQSITIEATIPEEDESDF